MIAPNPAAKLWLFDFDNTLVALEREVDWPGSRRELEAWLLAQGVDQRVFTEIPKGNLPLYAALHSQWLRGADGPASPPPANARELLRHASAIIERHEFIGADRAAPLPGAIALLEALAARAAVAIVVTSNSSRTVARWLARSRAAHLVRAIVGRDSLLALKPSPEMLAHALALADGSPGAPSAGDAPPASDPADAPPVRAADAPTILSPADAVFVGDSPADFEAARAAGLGFYGVAHAESARDRLVALGATHLFASPAALQIHLNLTPSALAPDPDSE